MGLTLREKDVLALIAQGFTDRQIAMQLTFAVSTARKHRENLLLKFSVTKSVHLVAQYLSDQPDLLKKT
jgi:DNA-binding CsgD family transcriptional regulator